MVLADERVDLPVADPLAGIDDGRTLLVRDLVRDDTTAVVAAVPFSAGLLAA